MLVVALGPRSEVASLDATAIASGGCRGNTAGTRGTGLMPRRHKAPAGRTRARQPGPSAGLPDALRATVHWLSVADGRRRRSEDREPRREAGRPADRLRDLPYAEQYTAWQRARWHLGLGESPVDVLGTRGDTLLAAWFAGTGQVCYETFLQRAVGDDLVALGPATPYRACATLMANVGPWTVSANYCAYGASRQGYQSHQVARASRRVHCGLGPGGCQSPSHGERPQALALGEGAHARGPPPVPDLRLALEPHPVLQGLRHASPACHGHG